MGGEDGTKDGDGTEEAHGGDGDGGGVGMVSRRGHGVDAQFMCFRFVSF
jgi:hypothetical protein